ncbi:hypothetical protein MKL09_16790 [Methylobacterium sp. J-048]|uniref:hypothetical protein n=1 Tax=Methylobacterium sp. J-048 TaxID=2836635 RepID=UPI001FBA2CD2|nr:hypothetical protein [Methylobacterium sp. J-048]MCJ2058203.1 hypothetical protein [Methylobacterium sp. J-048]
MPDSLAVAASLAAVFTLGGITITRAGPHAGQATVLLAAMATALGMLAGIGALTRLDAQGPAVSRAEARPDYGMSWRPLARVPTDP